MECFYNWGSVSIDYGEIIHHKFTNSCYSDYALVPGVHLKFTHTLTNLQPLAVGFFKCLWPSSDTRH